MKLNSKLIPENSPELKNLIIRIFIWSMFALSVPGYTTPLVAEEIAVIVNIDNPVQKLTSREVSDVYLSRIKGFPRSSSQILVLEQPRNSVLRENFFRLLNKMTLKQVNAYWARLQFSGEVLPPYALPDSQAVIEIVRNNSEAIGYIDAKDSDKSVRTILYLKD